MERTYKKLLYIKNPCITTIQGLEFILISELTELLEN